MQINKKLNCFCCRKSARKVSVQIDLNVCLELKALFDMTVNWMSIWKGNEAKNEETEQKDVYFTYIDRFW